MSPLLYNFLVEEGLSRGIWRFLVFPIYFTIFVIDWKQKDFENLHDKIIILYRQKMVGVR